VGIKTIINEESYTSIASFLDLDDLPVYQKGVKYRFSGRRVTRRLYKA
jgi:putative transposase